MGSVRLATLAKELSAKLVGNGDLEITGAQAIDKAQPTDITFVADEANLNRLRDSQAGAVIVTESLADSPRMDGCTKPKLFVENAKSAMSVALTILRPSRQRRQIGISKHANVSESARIGSETNIHPGVTIDDDVVIGDRCDIHPGVVLGAGTKIGDDCVLDANVVCYPDTEIGDRVLIHAGTVIGCDGYGYRQVNGRHEKVPHFGSVRIEDDVEIGANAAIDRAMIGETVIGTGTKIDNLVQIGHNCEVGRHNLIVSQVGMAGSVTTGEYVVLAGQVGVADHVQLGDGVVVGARAAINKNVPAGETWIGHPAMKADQSFKVMMASKKLPEMRETLRSLVKQVRKLESKLESNDDVSERRDAA
ncbi:UDP-3-O-(3-hydroxymyristoyl)glucosamine N-acyltransferase [Thalassoroseus pseudoceratinae]|uniref:UDP-3-O-(3-hydroxymyristoyl)glucosamine N-acyltransferase n=1 Tax=Thalassoroseus pseudoceratinae TaxID=2713176 RepID=UPI00141F16E3|nr:UDP-3-O-(3-hydroxymyristoyl)glucosamine N-acyltransferase [Thalassoroseus pseudoceratinae]